jgi:hypothetical protein
MNTPNFAVPLATRYQENTYVQLPLEECKRKDREHLLGWKNSDNRQRTKQRIKFPYTRLSCVYGIVDPRTQELVYVGVTKNLGIRLCKHRQSTTWYRTLEKKSRKPGVLILELRPTEKWEREKEWIQFFKHLGMPLFNKERTKK